MDLATLFGFAAGHVGLQPGGLFSCSSAPPCAPWKAALSPVVTSAGTTAVFAVALGRVSGLGYSHFEGLHVARER